MALFDETETQAERQAQSDQAYRATRKRVVKFNWIVLALIGAGIFYLLKRSK